LNLFRILRKKGNYRTNKNQIDSDALFSLSSAHVTLETKLNLRSTGKAAISLKSVSGRLFAETIEEIKNFLDVSKTESDLSYKMINDSYGYLWIILQCKKIEDIISGISAVGQIVHDRNFSKQLFAALFQFSNANNRSNNRYLIYSFALNKFYPFVPVNKNERDNEIEREIMKTIVDEMPFEKDVSLWYPIWDHIL
jgi:PspA associated protein B